MLQIHTPWSRHVPQLHETIPPQEDGWSTQGPYFVWKVEVEVACLVEETFFPVDDSVRFDVVVRSFVGLVARNSCRLLHRCFVFLCLGDPIPMHLIQYLVP